MHSLVIKRSGSWLARFLASFLAGGCWVCVIGMPGEAYAQSEVAAKPFRYSGTPDDNPVSQWFAKVTAGELTLEYEEGFGYLRSILAGLEIPVSSQALVYSKTSLQAYRISPDNPRAIYFNDDVYVGWVRGSSLLEISTTDPRLGAAFYTMQMTPGRANLRRENNRCLACHELPMTQEVPGHAVRSVLTRRSGNINSLTRSFVTDHTSPMADRWGGWYVTGQLGGMEHMGNAFLEGEQLVRHGAADRMDLKEDIDVSLWPSPHSDVVALMVMEHQTQMQNRFTRANVDLREAIEAQADSQQLQTVIEQAAEPVVEFMLFAKEAPLTAAVRGSTQFADEFANRGPRTKAGVSLRDFDLKTRLFRLPCSYLIYSASFAALDDRLREQIYKRLWEVLTAPDPPARFSHLSDDVRASIVGTLRETKPDLPDYWH